MGRLVRLNLLLLLTLLSCRAMPELGEEIEEPLIIPIEKEQTFGEIDPLTPEESFTLAMKELDYEEARSLWKKQGPFFLEDPLENSLMLQSLFVQSLFYPEGMGNVSVLEILGDDLWIGTWDGGVYRYSLVTEQWLEIQASLNSLSVQTVHSIREEGSFVWIQFYNRMARYLKVSSQLIDQSMEPALGRMKDLLIQGDQRWIGTALGGMYHQEKRSSTWDRSFTSTDIGLQINSLVPQDSGFYICTADKGLFFWNGNRLEHLYNHFLPVNITAVEQWNNFLWVGTYGQGLFRIDSAGNYTHYTEREGTFSDDWILSSKASENYLFWGTLGGGITFFYDKDSRSTLGLRDGLGSMDISDIEWYNGSLYVGTLGGGISLIDETVLDFRIQNP